MVDGEIKCPYCGSIDNCEYPFCDDDSNGTQRTAECMDCGNEMHVMRECVGYRYSSWKK